MTTPACTEYPSPLAHSGGSWNGRIGRAGPWWMDATDAPSVRQTTERPMSEAERLPITVLCGFLGSGKTTILRRWQSESSLRDAAYIIHDLSEFGLDAELLADEDAAPKPGRLVKRVAALHGIHAREQLHASVGHALGEITELDPRPPHVLCESTSAARPWPLIAALTQDKRFQLRHFIVTVDALNLHRDFADGLVLTGEVGMADDPALPPCGGNPRRAAPLCERDHPDQDRHRGPRDHRCQGSRPAAAATEHDHRPVRTSRTAAPAARRHARTQHGRAPATRRPVWPHPAHPDCQRRRSPGPARPAPLPSAAAV
ncbi:MAG TPA: hypothetical protein DFR83_23270 [Deltaproteobacteria bacterium]|nr:hypothetical protein [Deltaproteobacteria bacterium]